MKTAVIVGAGHRALNYASYAEKYPEKFKIVGVAEPSAERRRIVCERFGIPAERAFCSAEELAAVKPVLEWLPGWKEDISAVTSYDKLPENAKKYLARIAELVDSELAIISVGPRRDQTFEV